MQRRAQPTSTEKFNRGNVRSNLIIIYCWAFFKNSLVGGRANRSWLKIVNLKMRKFVGGFGGHPLEFFLYFSVPDESIVAEWGLLREDYFLLNKAILLWCILLDAYSQCHLMQIIVVFWQTQIYACVVFCRQWYGTEIYRHFYTMTTKNNMTA